MYERVSFATLFFTFLAILLMALLTLTPETASSKAKTSENKKKTSNSKHKVKKQQKQPSSWDQIKNLLSCKQVEGTVHNPSKPNPQTYPKLGSCSSICTFRDVAHGNTSKVVHRADNSPESSSLGQETRLLHSKKSVHGSSSSRSLAASSVKSSGGGSTYSSTTAAARAMKGCGGSTYSTTSRGMQFRKLSGCYECHMIVDPSRYPLPRTTICACPECGEVFPKIESLEHHQAVKHAVSELGPEDSSRNIVEIIFKSSWLKKDNPICKIERILKVHNTPKTIQRFEDCREAVKIRANANNKKNARCAADGNELLRFHCTPLTCALGSRGSTSLCGSGPNCGVCTIIRHGFQGGRASGTRTTASSGRAHDCLNGGDGRRAMLVCRVIAGRVKRPEENTTTGVAAGEDVASGSYDSVAGYGGVYSNLEELHVYNPRAILPCFVVIYKAVDC